MVMGGNHPGSCMISVMLSYCRILRNTWVFICVAKAHTALYLCTAKLINPCNPIMFQSGKGENELALIVLLKNMEFFG